MYNGCNSCGGGSVCGIGGNWLWIVLIALVIVWVIGDHGSCGSIGCGGCGTCGGCDCGFTPSSDNGCGCNR